MKKISSSTLFITKKVFPIIWFGVLAIVFLTATFSGGRQKVVFPLLLIPIFMSVFGYFLLKYLVWDLVDEVYDEGDSLLVKNGPEEERVAFSNIMNVSASTLTNPPRITLKLVTPGKFGEEIAFSPMSSRTLNPFAKNPIAEDLIVRAYQARSKRPF